MIFGAVVTTMERVRYQVSPSGIYCGQSGAETGVSRSTSIFVVTVPVHQCITLTSLYLLLEVFIADKVALRQVFLEALRFLSCQYESTNALHSHHFAYYWRYLLRTKWH
jgi:hypothetical protein